MSINAIKTQMLAMQAKKNVKNEVHEEKHHEEKTNNPPTTKQTTISAEDVFKYMSATTTPVTLRITTRVPATTSQESAARISESMKIFEEEFAAKYKAVKSEFGNISDTLAEKITLSMF